MYTRLTLFQFDRLAVCLHLSYLYRRQLDLHDFAAMEKHCEGLKEVDPGMFVDIQCYPLEIFAKKKKKETKLLLFSNSCVTQLMIKCSKLTEVISNYPNVKELFPRGSKNH